MKTPIFPTLGGDGGGGGALSVDFPGGVSLEGALHAVSPSIKTRIIVRMPNA